MALSLPVMPLWLYSAQLAMDYSSTQSPVGPIHSLATQGGLVALYFESQIKKMETRFAFTTRRPGRRNPWLMRAEAFVACYFSGDLNYAPEINLVFEGTDMQRAVWGALTDIQPGKRRTYSQIAKQVNHPTAIRAVASAIGYNPIAILIPCHRVIGSSGHLTGYTAGLDIKRCLIAHEEKFIVQQS